MFQTIDGLVAKMYEGVTNDPDFPNNARSLIAMRGPDGGLVAPKGSRKVWAKFEGSDLVEVAKDTDGAFAVCVLE